MRHEDTVTAWTLADDANGDPTIWHGPVAVARPGDLRVAHGYQQMLFDLLVAVLVQPPETVERVMVAIAEAHGEFGARVTFPHWGRHLARAALAALTTNVAESTDISTEPADSLASAHPPQDAVGHVAHAMRRLEHIHDAVAEEVDEK